MDVRVVSRWFGAASLVVGSVALTIGTAVEPSGDDDSVAVALAKVSRHLGDQRWLIVTDLFAAFMLPAVICLMRLARRGAPVLALAGGTLAFTGWLGGLIGLGSLDLVFYHGAQEHDRAAATRLIHAVTNDRVSTVLLVTFIVGQVLGMLLLGAALYRARVVPRFAAVLVGLGPLAQVPAHDSTALSVAVFALVAVGLITCAASVLRVEDDAWDVPAVDRGSARELDLSGPLASPASSGR